MNTEEGKGGKRADNRNLIAEAQDAGIQYAWNTETFDGLKLDGTTPVLALLEDSHMKYEADRADTDEPSLEAMTRAAIEYLKNDEDGFYLMVEAGRVDHANHDGKPPPHGDRRVGVRERPSPPRDELTEDEDTLIIATADHSHALITNGYCGRGTPILGLCMGVSKGKVEHNGVPETASDGKPYTVVGYLNGPGSILKEGSGGNLCRAGRPREPDPGAGDRRRLPPAVDAADVVGDAFRRGRGGLRQGAIRAPRLRRG